MWVLDASAVLHGWDNYPAEQFPPLWRWIATQIHDQELVISSVALDEVGHKSPECQNWLKESGITRIVPDGQIIQIALSIKNQLGIISDNYHVEGVDENDLFIVATALSMNHGVVTNESKQPSLPNNRRKYKIPAVCNLPSVKVQSLSFTDLIKTSRKVFA